MTDVVLSVRKLCKTFLVHVQQTTIPAIRDLSFDVSAGSIAALTGPSGAGKSSILKCIYRTYLPSSGMMLFRKAVDNGPEDGIDLASIAELHMAELRAQDIGFVTQFLHCLPRKSALDVVAEPLIQQRVDRNRAHERAAMLLEHLSIPKRLWNLAPATFSGGEQQRINIARGFVRQNRLLLLDEPTASLDPASAERVLELIERARDAGSAIIAIWHDRAIVERLANTTVAVEPAPAAISI
jgi:alpha-D-ribose 1-methylphosphonate 5-triphosphate synthase subunit PhnL